MSGEIQPAVREEICLPNEILAIIINELGSDAKYNPRTRAALASCRFASHVLYSLATPLFFPSIRLSDWSIQWTNGNNTFKKRVTELEQILTTSDIAASVHTLTLLCRKANFENSINGTLISGIMYRLPHIRTFNFTCFDISGESLEFTTSIASDFTSAIKKTLCRSPNLTTLNLDNIVDLPITVIIACPNLERLRLMGIKFCFDYTNSIDETSCSLDSLEMDEDSIDSLGLGVSGFYGDISFAKYFSRIKNLQLKNLFCCDSTFKHGWDIMLLVSQSLTTLDIYDEFTHDPVSFEVTPFDLSRFPALQHFNIQIRISYYEDSSVTMLSFVNRLLSIPSSGTSNIETLEIRITCQGAESDSEPEEDLFSWSRLDVVLSSDKFVSLKKVVLQVNLEVEDRYGLSWYDNQMSPELERRSLPSYFETFFSMFPLTSAQRTLEISIHYVMQSWFRFVCICTIPTKYFLNAR